MSDAASFEQAHRREAEMSAHLYDKTLKDAVRKLR